MQQARHDLEMGRATVDDFGSWDGRWPFLSRFQHEAVRNGGLTLPTGGANEVYATTSHKEIVWSHLTPERKKVYQMAAADQWGKWLEHNAIKVMSMAESRMIRQELQRRKERAYSQTEICAYRQEFLSPY